MRQDWQLKTIQLLAVPGLLTAFFLYLYHQELIIGVCKPGGWSNCDAVSGPYAPFSKIPLPFVGDVPVALIGLIGYAAIFLTVWLRDFVPIIERYAGLLLGGMVTFALLFTTGLTALEAFVLNAWCQYCLLSAAIIVVMFGLTVSYWVSARRARRSDVAEQATAAQAAD